MTITWEALTISVPADETEQTTNRLHLDLYAEVQSVAVEISPPGSHQCRRRATDHGGWVILRDPESNEFCLPEPR